MIAIGNSIAAASHRQFIAPSGTERLSIDPMRITVMREMQ
jgi:hypothetical protein